MVQEAADECFGWQQAYNIASIDPNKADNIDVKYFA